MAGENLDPVLQAQLRETYGISPPDTVGPANAGIESRIAGMDGGSVDNPLTPMGPGQGKFGENDPNSFLGRILYNADKTAGKAIADSNPPQLPPPGQQAGQQAQQAQGETVKVPQVQHPGVAVSGGGAPSPNAGMPANDRARAEDKLGILKDTPGYSALRANEEDLLKQREDLAELNRQSQDSLGQAGLAEQRHTVEAMHKASEAYMPEAKKMWEREQERNAKLEKLATQDPDRFWKNHFAGPVGSRVMAAVAMGFAGFNSPQALKIMSDNINQSIEDDLRSQENTYQNHLKIAERGRLADKDYLQSHQENMRNLDAVRIASRQLAADTITAATAHLNNSEAVIKAKEVSNQFLMDKEKLKMENEAKVKKEILEERERRMRAAAAQAREEYLHKRAVQEEWDRAMRDHGFRKDLQSQAMGPSLLKAAGDMSAANARRDEVIARLSKLKPDQDVPGYGKWNDIKNAATPDAARKFVMTDEESRNYGTIGPIIQSYVHDVTGAQSTDKEREWLERTIIGDGKAGTIRRNLMRMSAYAGIKQKYIDKGMDANTAATSAMLEFKGELARGQ